MSSIKSVKSNKGNATKDPTMHDIVDSITNASHDSDDSQDTEYELQDEPVNVGNEVDESEKLGLSTTMEKSVDIGPDGRRRRIVRQRIVQASPKGEGNDGDQ